MKTKCYSVRLASLVPISDRAYKATAFDGSETILPKSQVFDIDYSVEKSDAYWIAAWILEKSECKLQFSKKKCGWFNPATRRIEAGKSIDIEHHVPDALVPLQNNEIEELKR